MKTLTISISDTDFNRFGIKSESLSFADLMEIVRKEITRNNLLQTVKLSEKYGISKMSKESIDAEIKAVRDAKNHH